MPISSKQIMTNAPTIGPKYAGLATDFPELESLELKIDEGIDIHCSQKDCN